MNSAGKKGFLPIPNFAIGARIASHLAEKARMRLIQGLDSTTHTTSASSYSGLECNTYPSINLSSYAEKLDDELNKFFVKPSF